MAQGGGLLSLPLARLFLALFCWCFLLLHSNFTDFSLPVVHCTSGASFIHTFERDAAKILMLHLYPKAGQSASPVVATFQFNLKKLKLIVTLNPLPTAAYPATWPPAVDHHPANSHGTLKIRADEYEHIYTVVRWTIQLEDTSCYSCVTVLHIWYEPDVPSKWLYEWGYLGRLGDYPGPYRYNVEGRFTGDKEVEVGGENEYKQLSLDHLDTAKKNMLSDNFERFLDATFTQSGGRTSITVVGPLFDPTNQKPQMFLFAKLGEFGHSTLSKIERRTLHYTPSAATLEIKTAKAYGSGAYYSNRKQYLGHDNLSCGSETLLPGFHEFDIDKCPAFNIYPVIGDNYYVVLHWAVVKYQTLWENADFMCLQHVMVYHAWIDPESNLWKDELGFLCGCKHPGGDGDSCTRNPFFYKVNESSPPQPIDWSDLKENDRTMAQDALNKLLNQIKLLRIL